MIKFYSTKDEYGCFSNFSSHPIWIGSRLWHTSEHYFQSQKFLNGNDVEEIASEISPMKAAQIGRDRSRPIYPDWDERKDDVMRRALWAKVLQHHDVYESLLKTGTEVIVEHTPNDRYWADGGDGTGKNMLGILLMEIRTQIFEVEAKLKSNYFSLMRPERILFPLDVSHPFVEGMFWNMSGGEEWATIFSKFELSLTELGLQTYREVMGDFRSKQSWL